MTFHPAAPLTDLAEGVPVGLTIAGIPVLLVRIGDDYRAVVDECPHARVRLSFGDVDQGRVECIGHGTWFDLATGECLGPLATDDVAVLVTEIRGDEVWVDVGVHA